MAKRSSNSNTPDPSESQKRSWLPGLALIILVMAAYAPALKAGFIWDDDDYVTENEQLTTSEGLRQIWFEPGMTPQYYPMVHTSYWIEYQLWGLEPAGYHFNNNLLHALTALMLWLVLRRLSVPGAWFAAALFAVHPVEVESVAWVTERKNVLSGFLYMSSAWFYFKFAGTDGESRGLPKHYAFALLLFIGALLSKTVTASLPAAILIVFWWKRGSLRIRDWIPLIPFFIVGAGLGLTTAYLEKFHVGAEGADWSLSTLERFMVAGRISLFYAFKLIWPDPLAFFYTRWDVSSSEPLQYFFPLTVVAMLGAAWWIRDRIGRGVLAGLLFFGGTLAPALGFLDVYPMRFSYVADHFQYLAGIGMFVLFGALMQRVADPRNFFGIRNEALALVFLILGTITVKQIASYKDLETLWRDTIERNPAAWVAHNNLGIVLKDRGDTAEAEACYREAIRLLPTFVDARNNLGTLLSERGDHEEARELYEAAIELDPKNERVLINLSSTLATLGRNEEALARANTAIEFASARAEKSGGPPHAHFDFYYKRASALWGLRRVDEARTDLDLVLELQPGHVEALALRGLVAAASGKLDEAMTYFETALEIHPGSIEALGGLCQALVMKGDRNRAVPLLKKLHRLQPTHPLANQALRQYGEL